MCVSNVHAALESVVFFGSCTGLRENAEHENARHKTLLANSSEMRLMFKLQPSLLNRILNDIGQYYNVENTNVVNLKNVFITN